MKDNFSFKLYKAKNSKRTLFFFPAGFTSMWMYRYTVYSLNRMGITVVGFNFKWRKAINESNLDDLIKMVDEVNDVVTQIQNESTDQNTKYSVFGTSFGSVLALYYHSQ